MVFGGDFLVRVNGIAWTRQGTDEQPGILNPFQVITGRALAGEQLLDLAMGAARIRARADLDAVQPEASHLLQHAFERQLSEQNSEDSKFHSYFPSVLCLRFVVHISPLASSPMALENRIDNAGHTVAFLEPRELHAVGGGGVAPLGDKG